MPAQGQPAAIGVNAPFGIDDRKLVGKVTGAGPQECGDELALAGPGTARQKDGPPTPGNGSGVHEHELRRAVGDQPLGVIDEEVRGGGEVRRENGFSPPAMKHPACPRSLFSQRVPAIRGAVAEAAGV